MAISTETPGPQPLLAGAPVTSGGDADFGERSGMSLVRDGISPAGPGAIRYYDIGRDFQPGVQRVGGRTQAGEAQIVEFPGALDAGSARGLIESARARTLRSRETLHWRMAELDPQLAPGTTVRIPEKPGLWLVESWEWHNGAVELALARQTNVAAPATASDPGTLLAPSDNLTAPTLLRAFELPWDGTGLPAARQLYVAAAANNTAWTGASIYAERQGQLEPVASSGRIQAVSGVLAGAVSSSAALLFEPAATIAIELAGSHLGFEPTDMAGLAAGRNRILVGDEILQFAGAEQIAPSAWRLTGLLRGRGGTEPAAGHGHSAGTAATLLDDRLVALGDAMALDHGEVPVAAIGRGDPEPVIMPVENAGLSIRPLTPVHAGTLILPSGEMMLCWTRRSRGNWQWADGLETPLHEDFERYRVGIGPIEDPAVQWEPDKPQLILPAAVIAAHPGEAVWVLQMGNGGMSEPLLLTRF